MEENILCTVIRNLWMPLVILSLLLLAYLFVRYQRETDLMKKEHRKEMLKYPIILLLFSIISISFWDFLISGGILPIDCHGELTIFSSTHAIKTFADNSSEKNISFSLEGGFNSDTEIILPRSGRITKAKFALEHDPEAVYFDGFNNWSGIESHEGVEINADEGYAYIKARTLDLNQTQYLEGTQIFDDVYIRKGGELRVPVGKMLDLKYEEHSQ